MDYPRLGAFCWWESILWEVGAERGSALSAAPVRQLPGSARDTANMSPDGRGGTGYVLKK